MSKETEPQPPAPGGTGDGSGAGTPPNAGQHEVAFTPAQQAQIDALVNARLARGKEKWEADAAALRTKVEQEAEATRLAEQQKWQELAGKREAEVKALEGKLEEGKAREGRLARLEAALQTQLATQRTGLPPHLLALLDKMPVEEQLEYLATNAAVLRPAGQAAPIPPTPPGQTAPGLTEEQRRAASASVRAYW